MCRNTTDHSFHIASGSGMACKSTVRWAIEFPPTQGEHAPLPAQLVSVIDLPPKPRVELVAEDAEDAEDAAEEEVVERKPIYKHERTPCFPSEIEEQSRTRKSNNKIWVCANSSRAQADIQTCLQIQNHESEFHTYHSTNENAHENCNKTTRQLLLPHYQSPPQAVYTFDKQMNQ